MSGPLHGSGAKRGRRACAAARRGAGRVGEIRLRVVCLDDTGGGETWTLAAVGADARRAAEDSATVGYIGEPDPAARRFSRPILESAGIVQIRDGFGAAAMHRLRGAIRKAGDAGNLRESVRDALAGG